MDRAEPLVRADYRDRRDPEAAGVEIQRGGGEIQGREIDVDSRRASCTGFAVGEDRGDPGDDQLPEGGNELFADGEHAAG